MKTIGSRILASVLPACTLLALAAAPAPAAISPPSGGATTYNQSSCQLYETDYVCTDIQGEYNTVATPKGQYIYQGHDRYEFTVYRDGVFYYGGEGSNIYTFVATSRQQQNLSRYSQILTNDVETCTYSYAYHLVNGQLQFDNFEWSCVPV